MSRWVLSPDHTTDAEQHFGLSELCSDLKDIVGPHRLWPLRVQTSVLIPDIACKVCSRLSKLLLLLDLLAQFRGVSPPSMNEKTDGVFLKSSQ